MENPVKGLLILTQAGCVLSRQEMWKWLGKQVASVSFNTASDALAWLSSRGDLDELDGRTIYLAGHGRDELAQLMGRFNWPITLQMQYVDFVNSTKDMDGFRPLAAWNDKIIGQKGTFSELADFIHELF